MINYLKQLFSMKVFLIVIVMQMLAVLLYTGTVSYLVNENEITNEIGEYDFQLQQVILLNDLTLQEYNKFNEELIKFGVMSYNYYAEYDETTSIITIDQNLANYLNELNLITLSNDNTVSCDYLFLMSGTFTCDRNEIVVEQPAVVQKWLLTNEYGVYNSLITSNTLYYYDGDLNTVFKQIFSKLQMKMNYQVLDSEDYVEASQGLIVDATNIERQIITMIVIIDLLLVLIITVYYLTIKQHNIAILNLLGHSNLKIIMTIISFYTLSLSVPLLILELTNNLVVIDYLVLDFIIGGLVIGLTFLLMKNMIKNKVREQ